MSHIFHFNSIWDKTINDLKNKGRCFNMANCPYCGKYFNLKQKALDHINDQHGDELEKSGMDAAQMLYYSKWGRITGICMCGCGKETKWNYKTGKPYKLSDDPKCRERVYQKAEQNMMAARGVHVHTLLHDMEHQKEMQTHRPTYSTYRFSDGGEVGYLSQLEMKFLHFCDTIMEFTSNMFTESPEIFKYYDAKDKVWRQYIPDYYLPDYNLIVEIKDANNQNPAFVKDTKYKVAYKNKAMQNQTKYNFIIIHGTNYGPFVEALYQIVHKGEPDGKTHKNQVVITETACTDLDEMINLQAIEDAPTDKNYYLMVGTIPGTNIASCYALSYGETFSSWIIYDVADDILYESSYQDKAFSLNICQCYRYIGKADISDVYHQLSILLRSGSSKNILIVLRENEIYFDNGSGIANNDGRKMMFVPMDIDQSVKTLEESVMKLCR